MDAKQLKYAQKYRDVLLYIYKITNKLAIQSDVLNVLIETKYCNNPSTARRILQRLEKVELIKRGSHKRTKIITIELTKTAIGYLEPDPGKIYNLQPLEGTGTSRYVRNIFYAQFFYREYIEGKDVTLSEALHNCLNRGFCNVYSPSDKFYSTLKQFRNLPFYSFQLRECTFFRQEEIIKQKKAFQKELFIYSSKRERGEDVGEPPIDNSSKSWTLDDLKRRQVYLNSVKLKQSKLYKDKKREDYKPLVLCLKFKHFNTSTNPKALDLLRLYQTLQRYIKKTFQMHYESFLRKHGILESIVQVEVELEIILLNKLTYDAFKDSILKRLPDEPIYTAGSRHIFDFKLSHLDVMPHNQHLLPKPPKG